MRESIKRVAYNPITRRYEEVFVEDELKGITIICLIWSESLKKWITIPG